MTSLILEGGTMRDIFTAGVLDGFLENNIEFPYIIGVSGGMSNGISYISKQNGRNLKVLNKLKKYKRLSIDNILHNSNVYNLDFIFGDVLHRIVPFDYKTFYAYKGTVLAVVTNAITGESEYLDVLSGSVNNEVIKATCSVPGLFKPQRIKDNLYFDGGVSDSIPILKSIKDGNKKHVVILTQPKGFIKKMNIQTKLVIKLLEGKYPEISKALSKRHEVYNLQIELCELLEKQGKALIIRPPHKLSSKEDNLRELEKTYNIGKKYVYDNLNKIENFLVNDR